MRAAVFFVWPEFLIALKGTVCMRVRVFSVHIPALSTLGFGYGIDVQTGEEIRFCGDHRSLRNLGETLRSASEPPEAEVEPWQIL